MSTERKFEFERLFFSSELTPLEYTTDLDRLTVSIMATASGEQIFSTTLYAYDGVVCLYGCNEIVEQYMIAKGLTYVNLSILCASADGDTLDSTTVDVLYCSFKMPINAEIFASQHFLTVLTAKRTTPHSSEPLTILVNKERNYLKAHCVYLNSDGKSESAVVTLADMGDQDRDYFADTTYIEYDTIVEELKKSYDVETLIAYTIVFGERTFTYYVINDSPEMKFTFRNCFNAWETIALHAVTKQKTSVNRDIASINSVSIFYDQSVEKTYEVETAPLTSDEALWAEQLFISPSVLLGSEKVLITDNSSEITDSNATLNRLKFTWRFADALPHNLSVEALAERIFTEEFTYQYK